MDIKNKKVILIDLDGVLNTFDGTLNEEIIPPIKEGAEEFLNQLSKNFTVKLFTTRNKLLVAKWVLKNKIEFYIDDITDEKESCWLFIDDRCIKFNGNYSDLNNQIKNFKPWYNDTFNYFS